MAGSTPLQSDFDLQMNDTKYQPDRMKSTKVHTLGANGLYAQDPKRKGQVAVWRYTHAYYCTLADN